MQSLCSLRRTLCVLSVLGWMSTTMMMLLPMPMVAASADRSPSVFKTISPSSPPSPLTNEKGTKLLQIHVIHRHGDRTPITPLVDDDYWESTLVPQSTIDGIAQGSEIVGRSGMRHSAQGRGPYGKLTQLGLLQMIKVGSALRERYLTSTTEKDDRAYQFADLSSLGPRNVRIYSTDFSRTIQSVQGLLVGLFPDVEDDEEAYRIPIDVSLGSLMIPDPQPRHSQEQHDLEQRLTREMNAQNGHLLPLAHKATKALQPLLAEDAHQVSFGVDAEDDMSIEVQPLSWNQLAELTKCLQVRDRLPPEINEEDVQQILDFTAQRWFHNLRNAHLIYLAMNPMVQKQVDSMIRCVQQSGDEKEKTEKPIVLWSAHDSTLISMLCAYRLHQPAEWPPYASYLIAELLQVASDTTDCEYVVRFSLNGNGLKIQWEDDDEAMDTIPLDLLEKRTRTVGATPERASE